MNNDRGNDELTVNIPKDADFDTFKSIMSRRTGAQTDDGLEKLYAQFRELNERDAQEGKELIAIVGDLYEKYKDKTDYQSTKRITEIEDVAAYLYDTGQKVSIIAEGESPDFIIEINGEKMGLEHTVYVNDATVAKISTVQAALSSAEKKILAENPEAKLLFNVSVALDQLPNKNELNLSVYEFFSAIVKGESKERPAFITDIIDSKHETLQIKYNEKCKPTPIDIEYFETKLDAKNAKIEKYKANCGLDKINLLIVMEGIGCKSNFYIDLDKMPKKQRSFYEIIIYNRFERTILVGKVSQ